MTLKEFWDKKFENFTSEKIEFRGTFGYFVGSNWFGLDGKFLWAENGRISIPIKNVKTFGELENMCFEYLNGNYICCNCGKCIPQSDLNGFQRHFAGIYCNDCWTPEQEKNREIDYSCLD